MLISAHDVILEEENAHVPKDISITVALGSKILDTLNIKNPEKSVAVPLSKTITEDKIVICCYSSVPLVDGSHSLGSVSIPQYIILNGGLQTYSQWITLFEYEDDNEYDGEIANFSESNGGGEKV